MKKSNAFIIGRFQPIHLGHVNLIKRYYNAGFRIKIGIGSSNNKLDRYNPLSAKERQKQIKDCMKEFKIKDYKIYKISDTLNDENYVNHVLKIVKGFDTIITGNPFVLKLFIDHKSKTPWNIESFDEKRRPGGRITSGIVRKLWLKKPSNKGLPLCVYKDLIYLDFTKRLNELK